MSDRPQWVYAGDLPRAADARSVGRYPNETTSGLAAGYEWEEEPPGPRPVPAPPFKPHPTLKCLLVDANGQSWFRKNATIRYKPEADTPHVVGG